MATFTVEVVSMSGEVWEGDAQMIVAKTVVGEMGILAGHEPVLAVLAKGPFRVTLPDGDVLSGTADGGFLSVERDTVRLVAREAEIAG